MAKNVAVRLKCPYGDQDQWVILQNRSETLKQILDTPWDFECPVHGVQREIPIQVTEKFPTLNAATRPKPLAPQPVPKREQRSSNRLSLHVPVLVYGWTKEVGAFHEDASTFVVNASGGLVSLTTRVERGDTIFLVNKATREEQECRVAYAEQGADGQTRAGIAFKRPSPSFWRTERQEYRIAKVVRVSVRGVDRNGNSFLQSANAIDLSRNGARLDGVGFLTWPGETIEVKRGWKKARFRVVWVGQPGTQQANQIGICSLEPDKSIWGIPFP